MINRSFFDRLSRRAICLQECCLDGSVTTKGSVAHERVLPRLAAECAVFAINKGVRRSAQSPYSAIPDLEKQEDRDSALRLELCAIELGNSKLVSSHSVFPRP